jgi:hypothetical protein
MEKVTKKDVKASFKAIRQLMRIMEHQLNEMESLDDLYLEEGSEIGQLGLELIAEATMFDQYREFLRTNNYMERD